MLYIVVFLLLIVSSLIFICIISSIFYYIYIQVQFLLFNLIHFYILSPFVTVVYRLSVRFVLFSSKTQEFINKNIYFFTYIFWLKKPIFFKFFIKNFSTKLLSINQS